MNIQGIIFDCDGVILDSETIFLDSLQSYLLSLGIRTNINDLSKTIGSPMNQIVRQLKQMYPLDRYPDCQLIEEERSVFRKTFQSQHLKAMPGLKQLLQKCKEKHVYTSIASSSDSSYVLEVLTRLDIKQMFSDVIGGENVDKGKPDPDIYLYAIKKARINAENLVAIEDSTNGIKSSKAANLYTFGYKGSAIVQNTSEADKEIYSFSEIVI